MESTEKLKALIAKLNRELEIEKEEVAKKGTGEIFRYAPDYVQKCDMIAALEEISDLYDEGGPIPESAVDFLLNSAVTAFSQIEEYFDFYMDNETWQDFRESLIYAAKRASGGAA